MSAQHFVVLSLPNIPHPLSPILIKLNRKSTNLAIPPAKKIRRNSLSQCTFEVNNLSFICIVYVLELSIFTI